MRDRDLRAWETLVRASSEIAARVERDFGLATGGLSVSHFQTLRALQDADAQTVTLTDLADRLMLSQTRVSRVLDDLEREELVGRQKSELDGRNKTLVVTAAGKRRLNTATETYERIATNEVGTAVGQAFAEVAESLERVARSGRKPK